MVDYRTRLWDYRSSNFVDFPVFFCVRWLHHSERTGTERRNLNEFRHSRIDICRLYVHAMYAGRLSLLSLWDGNAQYTPPTPPRRNCRVASRRRCVHEFATSWRQFRRVVGVNTPVGSRDQNCKLAADGCVVRSNPSAVIANSCTHRRSRRDTTKQFRRVGVGGVYWA